MKKQSNALVQDVEALLEQSTLAEAAAKVWERFESAMDNLDSESVELLKQFFDGTPVAKLAETRGITEAQVQAWLAKAKRQLTQGLKNESQVRQ